MTIIAKWLALFVVAGLCESGGGYLVWQWWRNGASWLVGAALLVSYGFVPTFQPVHVGRVYAAYGGVFVLLSVLWGWAINRARPLDLLGTLCLAGVAVIMYWPS